MLARARAAGGVRNRGRRSTLAMPLPKSWQAQHSVHLGVCLCGRGSIRQLSRGTGCWRARGGGCEIVAGAALWRCRCRSRGRRSILCIWVCVCVAGVAFGSCLEGQDVGARAAGGVRNRGRRNTLAMPLPKSWQAQHSVHLGVCLCGRGSIRQLSRGTGCWRARGGGCAKSWQAQHFGDAVVEVVAGAAFCASGCVAGVAFGSCLEGQDVGARAAGGCAKSWQAQHFGDAVAEVVAGAAFCASGCVFVWQG